MSSPAQITSRHRDRLAVIYVRQSTLAQVRENTESTNRQYGLAEKATSLGWEGSNVLVIDGDLGLSGRSSSIRPGFKELVSRVCVGEVGAIFRLEVSRLARSSADFQRLLEFCSLTDTLIVDADGIYDLRRFNDRLLLGLKGTMSEAELHILAGRLHESRRAAAQRGELRLVLPVGYIYDGDGQVVMDPNEQIRAAITDAFAAFEATGSSYGVVGAFEGRPFPHRAYGGAWSGEVRWGRLTRGRILDLLQNPSYAGAYVYGRCRSQRWIDAEGVIRTRTVKVPRQEWEVVIQDHHQAYISWEAHLQIQQRLAANCTHDGARRPREGTALLQGIVLCGACGHAMRTNYKGVRPYYICSTSRDNHVQTPGCRTISATLIDAAIGSRLLEAVSGEQIALALAAADVVTERRARASRALELQVERARYVAGRAERAFHLCEPENRLVARSLEQRWESKLQALTEAEAALAAAQTIAAPLPARAELEALAADLPSLWNAPSSSDKDRKRLLRALIADVTLTSQPGRIGSPVHIGIHWRSGATEEILVARPAPFRSGNPIEAVDLIKRMAGQADHEIVAELARAGLRTGRGQPFDVTAVRWVRYIHRIPSAHADIAPGELTVPEVAAQLHVGLSTVHYWIRTGRLSTRRTASGRYRIMLTDEVEEACRRLIARSARIHRTPRSAVGGAV